VDRFADHLLNSIPLGLHNQTAQRQIVTSLGRTETELKRIIFANVESEEARKRKLERIHERLQQLAKLLYVDVESITQT
jgi:hypothetical protein